DAENRSIWRRFSRNLSVGLLGAVLSLAIKSAQTLLLTRALRMEDYGRVLIVVNLFVFLNSFIGLRVSDVMFRFFPLLRERREESALQGLLLLCLGVSATTGLLIFVSVLVFSPWLAGRLYQSPELAPLFGIYGWTILASSFSDVSGPILRMYDRFTSLVAPQVLGSLATFTILIAYMATTSRYHLTPIVAAFAVGVFVQTVPPLVLALRLVKPYLTGVNLKLAATSLATYRSELMRCLFNSNVTGYLKIANSPGDLFLLGIFSSPAQVALYGLAKQLVAPLALLLTNVQTALTPEITLLVAKRKLEQFKRLVGLYTVSAFVAGGLLTVCALLAGRFLILRLTRPEYVDALPLFYILLIAAWALLVGAFLRPLALSLDLLKWDNLAQLASTAVLLIFVIAGRLNALTLALVQLAGVLALRLLFYVPVWRRLRALTHDSQQKGVP
ncbi:MAG TPA: oligosaccharide flippase family protein, partial [Pyrinomonadaceae bacterium]